jgi:hypothetical protein
MLLKSFSDGDIQFLVETVDSTLILKLDTIKNDDLIIDSMLNNEVDKLYQQIMLMSEDCVMARITPYFLFEIMLRKALKELELQSYTIERTARQKIPVFDIKEVITLFSNKAIMGYLAQMLSSFTRIESYTMRLRVRKGVWRKVRFNDMDIDSLIRFCKATDEVNRFNCYKRIADLCLFILGIFPEYVTTDFSYPDHRELTPRFLSRLKRSADDYEEEGRRFYKLAGEHGDAKILELSEIFRQFHKNFNLVKKPLNFISDNLLLFNKQRFFPPLFAD